MFFARLLFTIYCHDVCFNLIRANADTSYHRQNGFESLSVSSSIYGERRNRLVPIVQSTTVIPLLSVEDLQIVDLPLPFLAVSEVDPDKKEVSRHAFLSSYCLHVTQFRWGCPN